jgi:hypothetical protein
MFVCSQSRLAKCSPNREALGKGTETLLNLARVPVHFVGSEAGTFATTARRIDAGTPDKTISTAPCNG